MTLRTVTATRYVTPLREGGSLPAIMEGDDDGTYVVKFRGAGQGPRVLIAELICGELGRALGLPIPEIVFVELDEALGRNEPHDEIKDLLLRSVGLNIALDYLPGALGFDPLSLPDVDPALASAVVWFDALITNVDRTPRNTNLLLWHNKLWLIDHGAALFFHFSWDDYQARAQSRFAAIKDHVLLPAAADIRAADETYAPLVTPELIHSIVDQIPEAWLEDTAPFPDSAAYKAAYVDYLMRRIETPRAFVEEAINARSQRV
jgi:hypothetical protein